MTFYTNVCDLADTLFMEIQNKGRGVLRGSTDIEVECCTGHSMKMSFEIVSSYASKDGSDIGVVCSGPGDLFLLASYSNTKAGQTTFIGVGDKSKVKVKELKGCLERRTVYDSPMAVVALKEGLVQGFVKNGLAPWTPAFT